MNRSELRNQPLTDDYKTSRIIANNNFTSICNAINNIKAEDNNKAVIGSSIIKVPYNSSNPVAISRYGQIWFDSERDWLMFRKRREDSDANVYAISLSDPIPE